MCLIQNYSGATTDYLEKEDNETTFQLIVHLKRKAVLRCQSDYWLSKYLTMNEDGNGMIQTKVSENFIKWLADFFLSCGTDAYVEEPKELVMMMKQRIELLSNQYEV